jgi:chromosome partitioning protein
MPMKVVLCTHHKGGVGKTELAVHVAGIFRQQFGKTLLIDCDSQADSWKFYFGAESSPPEGLRTACDDRLAVIWQPEKQRVGTRAALSREFEYIVIDVESALADTVQTLIQSQPDLVLVPVDNQHDALVNLKNPLAVIATLEQLTDAKIITRIVPMGVDHARVQAIRERIQSLADLPKNWQLWRRIPHVKKANLARKRRKYIWNYAGCEDLEAYYQKLVELT